MLIFYADQNSEIEYGLKGYYNTESRACIKKSLTCEKKAYIWLKNPSNS